MLKQIIVAGVATTMFHTLAFGETFHVSPTGNDDAAGTAAAPWRTIQRAANRAAPGDVVTIHAGTYTGFTVTTRATKAAPIAFLGEGDVRIDGAATADRDAVHIEGASYIRIEGLRVTGATRSGISALECDHITLARNVVDANGKWGIFSSFCDDLTVEDNEASRSGTQHGIYFSNSGDRPIARRNHIWGNAQCGIHLNGDITFGGDGTISGAIIEDNVIRDNGRLGGSGINGDGLVDATIRNNVLDGNHASGVSLYREDGGAPSTGNRVVNNTIRMAGDARWAVNIQDGSTRNVLRNNILLHPSASRGAIDICAGCISGTQSDHNAVVGRFSVGGSVVDLAGWRGMTGNDAGSFVAADAELFANAAAGDLSLRAGSPAIDAGMSDVAVPEVDIDGVARPQGAAVDIGAYEHCDGPCAGPSPSDPSDPGDPNDPVDPTPEEPAESEAEAGGCSAGGGAGLLVALAALATARRRSRR
ncbi:MAG: right-handed parallel beta-helix repeat-containing protein [Deltaproteobacteria bacterium]|nr:right-handed parallel beta-helix repeat-containing protein [Deltaproteobacteria bacterium]